MEKYVRVMDGIESNAGGFKYKIDEVNVTDNWNPDSNEPEKMGGFNFGTEDKILRWLHRGDTIYDVIIPSDAQVIHVDCEKGIYRTNKIIVTNPRIITDEMVLDLYRKCTLSDEIIAQCLVTLLWKDRLSISKYIIKDRVNLSNVDEIIKEYENYSCDGDFSYDKLRDEKKELYDILKEIQSPLDICLYVDKEPYIKKLSDDKIINLTGQTGSGKTTYALNNFSGDEYLIIDTDDIFSSKRFEKTTGINKELGEYFRNKYDVLPNCSDDFDLVYKEILDYCKKYDKTIVIDCAQFHCIKDIGLLKGTVIVIRTCIDNCYDRAIERFKNNGNFTREELEKYKERKKAVYSWYKFTNEFIRKMDIL